MEERYLINYIDALDRVQLCVIKAASFIHAVMLFEKQCVRPQGAILFIIRSAK